MKLDELGEWLKTAYDKLLLFVVLTALLLSAGWLIVRIAEERRGLSLGRGDLDAQAIQNAKSVDVGFIEDARLQIRNPFQAPENSRRLMTAEWRVPCLNASCTRPIPFDAAVCPYCQVKQPDGDPGSGDRDGDQLPDDYERAHKLNLNDSSDAEKDPDEDGFTTLEEHKAGTHPFEATNSPPPILKARLSQFRTIPISILWIGTSAIGENKMLFTIRDLATTREHYVEMNGVVSGFKITAYDRRETNVVRNGVSVPIDISVLTVQRGDRTYALTLNKMTQGDVEGELHFLPEDRRIRVKIGMEIKLKIAVYNVVDIHREAVIVSDVKTGRRYSVGQEAVKVVPSGGKQEQPETPSGTPAPVNP